MPRTPQRSGPPIEDFVSRFRAQLYAVATSRRAFVGWMRRAGVDDGVVGDLEVVFSELAANAVAASPRTSDDVDVRAHLDGDVLALEVSNQAECADAFPLPASPDREDTLRPCGRGLLIAEAFTDSVRMEAEPPDRFTVRCHRRVSGPTLT